MPTPSPPGLVWLRSERDHISVATADHARVADLTAAAASLGVALRTATVDDLVLTQTGQTAVVRVRGDRVDPRDTFFHTGSLGGSTQAADAWRLLSTIGILEAAGFMVTVPAVHSITWTDTIVPLLSFDLGEVRTLPSVRLCTREIEVHRDRLRLSDWGLEFPVAVRPAVRRPGDRPFVAENERRLTTLLQLAGASEVTVLVQPWLGEHVVEHTVVCVDGEPAGLEGALAERLSGPARTVATALGLAYVRIGFVQDADRFWLSHVDCTGFAPDADADALEVQLVAYREAFRRFRAARDAVSPSAAGVGA
ncbi:hypothetical protein [Streptomyces sp. Ag109_O5-10]|uniref:hypothetical protein n=1 Tax=Streptomyces sp. Ag109_O5-10 TaxID=1855349 RepID=UPI000896BBAC|nr:hypothetical protein [Streptomyces sp. Ag109_O5-10]SEF09418.1 hypothetical protein SAMN05216533_6207 [Streptomyces sp. Ag109_O5-10]